MAKHGLQTSADRCEFLVHRFRVRTGLKNAVRAPGKRVRKWQNDRGLARLLPFLTSYNFPVAAEASRLLNAYNDYISTVSKPDLAISFELACFLHHICLNLRPSSILDVGSGFSTFVFRTYRQQSNPECEIYSVDDSVDWLTKTREYLESHQLTTENLLPWEQFTELDGLDFDLILHDIGGSAGRAASLPTVLRSVHRNTILVLDDMHKPHYRRPIVELLVEHDPKIYDAQNFTLDEFGRYAYVVTGFAPPSKPHAV